MTTPLSQQDCEACRSDAPNVSGSELEDLLAQIPDWHTEVRNHEMQLERLFTFLNFQEALTFANHIGELAERVDHHPSLLVEWGKVTVCWWTHTIGGLHRNDFIMAAKTDRLFAEERG